MRDDGPAAALVPRLVVSSASRVEELERFSHYVGTYAPSPLLAIP
jgi:hypothetical protein